MSYRVEYPGRNGPDRERFRLGIGLQAMTAAFVLLFAMGVRSFWPAGQKVIRQWLRPGPVTEQFVERLEEGASLTDSLEELCREVFALDDA